MRDGDKQDWSSWEALDDARRQGIAAQLKREIGVSHRLFAIAGNLRVLAKDGASDDILACNPNDMAQAYVVHLVWSDGPSGDPDFPSVRDVAIDEIPKEFLLA